MNKLVHNLYTRYFIDLGDYRRTILLSGVGRSGTTWVGDLINYRNRYREMFEPFHCEKISVVSQFQYHQYLRPENRDKTYYEPAKTILSGRVKHPWIDRYNRKALVQQRLIKDVRTNLLLKWIKSSFPEIPIILLMRHPCAVASSRLKLGWESRTEVYLAQGELMSDFLEPFRALIEKTTDAFERHILVWCIQNFVPLSQFRNGEILVLYYEHLCVQPESELKRLFAFIGEPYNSSVMDFLRVPSALSQKQSAILSGEDLVSGWQKYISAHQVQKACEMLSKFGLNRIYGTDQLPLLNSSTTLP